MLTLGDSGLSPEHSAPPPGFCRHGPGRPGGLGLRLPGGSAPRPLQPVSAWPLGGTQLVYFPLRKSWCPAVLERHRCEPGNPPGQAGCFPRDLGAWPRLQAKQFVFLARGLTKPRVRSNLLGGIVCPCPSGNWKSGKSPQGSVPLETQGGSPPCLVQLPAWLRRPSLVLPELQSLSWWPRGHLCSVRRPLLQRHQSRWNEGCHSCRRISP